MTYLFKILFLLAVSTLVACDFDKDDEHLPPLKQPVKGEKVEALYKAKLVEQTLENAAVQERENINQQTR